MAAELSPGGKRASFETTMNQPEPQTTTLFCVLILDLDCQKYLIHRIIIARSVCCLYSAFGFVAPLGTDFS